MSGHTIFRIGLLLTGFVLAATGAAEAKIPQSQHAAAAGPNAVNPNALSENPSQSFAPPVQRQCEVTKIVTLDFGPLHFQEILKSSSKICRS
jgi:hypothetical protein